ncbi:MAG TPA: DUF6542 domain-containing protein [Actinomycetes bacterium]
MTTTTDGSPVSAAADATAAPTVTTDAPTGQATTTVTGGPPVLGPVVVTAPAVPGPGLITRARRDGVTGPAVVAAAALLVALGAAVDLQRDRTLGAGTTVALLLAALAAPAVVRFRSLPTALVLPPLLVAAAATGIAALGGQDRGNRELILDVGTTLALHAPTVFAAAALSVLVLLVRVGVRIARR